jgi:hypothetical protein
MVSNTRCMIYFSVNSKRVFSFCIATPQLRSNRPGSMTKPVILRRHYFFIKHNVEMTKVGILAAKTHGSVAHSPINVLILASESCFKGW